MTTSFRAYVLFTGGMIGVGFFGLPYVLSRAGLLATLGFGVAVLALVWYAHVLFADIVLATKERRRLPGYAGASLGSWGKALALLGNLPGLSGALLAYVLAGGTFLALLVRPLGILPDVVAVTVYIALGSVFVLMNVRQLSFFQTVILGLFGITLVALAVSTGPQITLESFTLLGAPRQLFLPYGVFLFSFWGLSLVPALAELVERDKSRLRAVLGWGFVTAAVTYLVFAIVVAGVSGVKTSEDAFSGLVPFVGSGVLLIGALFGFLTTFDSFIALSRTLAETLTLDLRVPQPLARVLVMLVPFFLYALGVHAFVRVLSVTGAVFIGLEGILVFAMAYAARRHAGPALGPVLLGGALAVGACVEALRTFGVF